MRNYKYSDFLKIDLHIHTDWSKKTKIDDYKGSFTVETLKERLKENDIGIFSLTDHNIINIDAYNEYYESYDESEDPLLLLGVELDLEIEHNGGTKSYHSLLIFREATSENAISISEKLEEKYTSLGITDPFKRKLNIEQVVFLFYGEDFFFIPHAHRHKAGIVEAYDDHIEDAQEMILLMPSALEKVKEEAIHKYNEGFDNLLSDSFKSREDIAYINFSDNHNIEKYPCIHKGDGDKGDHSFYYVKGTKSYETLRLSFIDPSSRISSPSAFSLINHSLNYIEKLEIKNDECLMDNTINFSPHMNVIIGGRSSGKSLLLDLLGHKIDNIPPGDKDRYKDKVDRDKVTIKSRRDADLRDTTSFSDELIYLNQGAIVRYFEARTLYTLAVESNKREEYDAAQTKFKERRRVLEERIDSLVDSYNSARESLLNMTTVLHRTTVESMLDENYILRLDSSLLDSYDLSAEIVQAKDIVFSLSNQLKELTKHSLIAITNDESAMLDSFREFLERKETEIKNKEQLNKKVNMFIGNALSLVERMNDSLSIESRKKEESRKSLNQLTDDITRYFKKLFDLQVKCDSLQNYNYAMKEKIVLDVDVKLVLEVADEESVKDLIVDGLVNNDKTTSLYANILSLISDSAVTIKNHGDKNAGTLSRKIKKILADLFAKIDSPIDYLEYSDGSSSKDNSPGYNSEKYLELILKNPKNKLILIDQPEDNLGNKFIADKLVSIIRKLKFKKQFILVTHNPSVVVYGDAENVIIAKNTNNKISYTQIVLEDQAAQKEICNILDGGEYIFDKRSKKYNIKRILREVEKDD